MPDSVLGPNSQMFPNNFEKVWRGYDPQQVDSLIDELKNTIQEHEALLGRYQQSASNQLEESARLKTELQERSAELGEMTNRYLDLADSSDEVGAVGEQVARMLQFAATEAAEIRSEAKLVARKRLAEAEEKAAGLTKEAELNHERSTKARSEIENHREELLLQAKQDAETLVEHAQAQAKELVETAEQNRAELLAKSAESAEFALAKARAEADRITLEADREADRVRVEAEREATHRTSEAQLEFKDLSAKREKIIRELQGLYAKFHEMLNTTSSVFDQEQTPAAGEEGAEEQAPLRVLRSNPA